MKVMFLREQTRPAKQLSFDKSGTTLTAACTDGMIYVYSLSSEQPQLIKRIDGLVGMIDSESENAVRPTWHPDGRAFAVPTATGGQCSFLMKSAFTCSRLYRSASRLEERLVSPESVLGPKV